MTDSPKKLKVELSEEEIIFLIGIVEFHPILGEDEEYDKHLLLQDILLELRVSLGIHINTTSEAKRS